MCWLGEYQVPFLCSSWRSAGWRCLKWESWSRTKFKVEWKENWSPSWGWLGARGALWSIKGKHIPQLHASISSWNPSQFLFWPQPRSWKYSYWNLWAQPEKIFIVYDNYQGCTVDWSQIYFTQWFCFLSLYQIFLDRHPKIGRGPDINDIESLNLEWNFGNKLFFLLLTPPHPGWVKMSIENSSKHTNWTKKAVMRSALKCIFSSFTVK